MKSFEACNRARHAPIKSWKSAREMEWGVDNDLGERQLNLSILNHLMTEFNILECRITNFITESRLGVSPHVAVQRETKLRASSHTQYEYDILGSHTDISFLLLDF